MSSGRLLGFAAAMAVVLWTGAAHAVPVYVNSTVVTSPTNTATFTSISGSLLGYTEDGLTISVNDNHCCFVDTHYGSGGNNSFVTISRVDGALIHALDFRIGDGHGGGPFNSGHSMNMIWETFVGTTSTGFGDEYMDRGSYVGWTDAAGFTSIRVAALDEVNAFGDFQAIALDDVRVTAAVPAPTTLLLVGFSLLAVGLRRRRT